MSDAVKIKGNNKGLVIHLHPEASFEEIKQTLSTKVRAAKGFFSGANFAFAQQGKLTTQEAITLADLCCQHGMIPLKENSFPNRETTVTIHQNLRSGQEVNYRGNVLLLGNVNPGAKITAKGDIMVMGSLLGSVHAGVEGDINALVIAAILRPLQLFIAGKPAGQLDALYQGPHMARLDKAGMVIVSSWPPDQIPH